MIREYMLSTRVKIDIRMYTERLKNVVLYLYIDYILFWVLSQAFSQVIYAKIHKDTT